METINNDIQLSAYLSELLSVPSYTIGSYTLDIEKRLLTLNNESLKLTKKESYLLAYFAANQNKLVYRKDILTTIWTGNNDQGYRSLDIYLCKLRKFLSKDPSILLVNVHGKGYRMVVD